MKKSYALFAALFITLTGMAQLRIQSGAVFYLNSGATVSVDGDVTSFTDIQGPGTLELKGTTLQNLNMNGFSIPNLQINNTSNVSLAGSAVVGTSLNFVAGKVQMNNYDLTLGSTTSFTGWDNARYFVTNGLGRLVKNNLGAGASFTFPVGADVNSYNPLQVDVVNGTNDNFGVRCQSNVMTSGISGDNFVKEVVDASWVVSEAAPLSANAINVRATWNAADELNGFNRSRTGISKYDENGKFWDMTNSMTGATISGTGPYTVTRTSTTSGTFAVGNGPVLAPLVVAPKVFLQGAYSSGTLMDDKLRTSGVLPIAEPYSAMTGFTHSGWGGGEKLASAKLSGASNEQSIVDWLFVELRRASDSSVIATKSVLLKRNGQIASIDGRDSLVDFINFPGEATGDYYVSIRHRNHLSVRTASKMTLGRSSAFAYDFTNAQNKAFQRSTITTNAAMAQTAGGINMMWAGNINNDNYVRFLSSTFPIINSDATFLLSSLLNGNLNGTITGYSIGDVNMDGRVRALASTFPIINSDNTFILSSVMGGNINATRQEHK